LEQREFDVVKRHGGTCERPTDPVIEELWQIVQEQRTELARLRGERGDPSPVLSGRPISRAGLFKAVAAGAVLAAGSELVLGPSAVLADGTEGATTFSTSAATGVTVKCTASSGTGIEVVGRGLRRPPNIGASTRL
jgi:hypothetical protein